VSDIVRTQLFGGPFDGSWVEVPVLGRYLDLTASLTAEFRGLEVELYPPSTARYRWESRSQETATGEIRWRVLVYDGVRPNKLARTWPL
jgi:hypothetical protein